MGLADITDRNAILAAVREYDQIGREAFLEKYGYGKAREYFLEVDGKRYDSKAIIGVAYRYQYPGRGPLSSADFSGGHSTVMRKLMELGFKVVVLNQKVNDTESGTIE